MIVARAFPGPGRTRRAARRSTRPSRHGTHVSGIAAGDANTTAPAGPDHPQRDRPLRASRRRRGSATTASSPSRRRVGHDADTPEIVEAFEAAVEGRDERHQLLGRRAADRPGERRDVSRRSTTSLLAGVVPVIAAGNDRDDFGLGTAGSPGTAPDAISVAAVSNSHVFAPALTRHAAARPSLSDVPIQTAAGAGSPARGRRRPDARRRRARSRAPTASPSTAALRRRRRSERRRGDAARRAR